jgi:hypothetical protein
MFPNTQIYTNKMFAYMNIHPLSIPFSILVATFEKRAVFLNQILAYLEKND